MGKFIAVDSGKYATKACLKETVDKNKKIKFRTKMDETKEESATNATSCIFEYEGEKYLIGDEAETVDFEKSKAKNIHKYSTYAAIAQLVEDGDTVGIGIGCPLSIYNNKEERTAYKNFMINKGKTTVIINGKSKTFEIDKVFVFAEGSGFIYKNATQYKDRLIGIIDIGGLNSNNCIYKDLLPIKSTSFTTNLGCNVLRNELKQKLNSAFSEVNLNDWQMEDIIKKGYIKSHKEESQKLISDYLKKHVDEILQECVKKGWDIKNIDLVFVGGGSKLLEKEIKEVIPDAVISENAEWDNVEGFAEIGALKYGQ